MIEFSIVKRAIDNADPYGLLACHAPPDEYDIETKEIAEIISENNSAGEIAETVAKVFSRTFNAKFSADEFIEAAGEIRGELDRLS